MLTNNPKEMKAEEHHTSSAKINPFKELPKPHQPQVEHPSPSSFHSSAEKSSPEKKPREITITLKPWKLMKGFTILVFLLGIFLLGRWSTGADSFSVPDFSAMFSQDSGPSGLVTGDAQASGDSAPESTATEAPPEVPAEEPVPKTSQSEAATEVETTAPTDTGSVESDVPEKVVEGSYSKVSLSIDGVYKDWKGTWGKIKGVKYTITNHEDGTIKPHHFVMVLEGYIDHGEKIFDVSYTSQKVKAGETLSDESAVSGGYAYSPTQLPDGDLKKVHVTLVLVDADGITIASADQDVDLSDGTSGSS